jgi:hypothetical protein
MAYVGGGEPDGTVAIGAVAPEPGYEGEEFLGEEFLTVRAFHVHSGTHGILPGISGSFALAGLQDNR